MTPEGKVKSKINLILKRVARIWKIMPVPSGFGEPNLDLNACVPCGLCNMGLFFAIEAKRPGKKPTPQQEATIRRIEAAGGKVFIIDGDTTELEEWLQKVQRSNGWVASPAPKP